MKTICTLWLMILGLPMMAQTSAKPAFNITDSSCITECKARVQQFKKNGNADRFQLDEAFFCHVSKFDKEKGASKLQLVNLGNDKVMSLTILQLQVNATNAKGQTGTLTADEPLELLKDAPFTRCKILNLDLGKGIFGGVTLNEVESLRLKITYDGQEKIYMIGKEK